MNRQGGSDDPITLDERDRQILRLLWEAGDLTSVALAERLGLSQSAVSRRMARLEKAGVLGPREVVLDREKLGLGVTVHLGVKLAARGGTSHVEFERVLTAIPEVQHVQHVLGRYDYRIEVAARDIADFERVLRRRIMALPGLGEVEANVVMLREERPGPLGA